MEPEAVRKGRKRTNAPIHEEITTPTGDMVSDIRAVRDAIGRGLAEDKAIRLFAGKKAKNWIAKNGVVIPTL